MAQPASHGAELGIWGEFLTSLMFLCPPEWSERFTGKLGHSNRWMAALGERGNQLNSHTFTKELGQSQM